MIGKRAKIARDSAPRSFSRSVNLLVLGAGFGQLATIAASPILSRLLTPAQFGTFGVIIALESMLLVGATLRFDQALVLPRRDEDAKGLLILGAISVALFAGLSVSVALLFGGQIANAVGIDGSHQLLYWVPAILLVEGGIALLSHWALRERAYVHVSGTRAIQGVGTALSQVASAAATRTTASLTSGVLIGRFAGLVWLWTRLRDRLGDVWEVVSRTDLQRLVKEYRRFPLYATPGSAANSAGVHAPGLLLTAIFGPQVGGLYLLGMRVVEAPMLLIGQSVSQVLLGEGADASRDGPASIRALASSAMRRLALLLVLPIVLVGAIAPALFEWVFGSNWREAGVYLQILAPALVVRSLASPMVALLVAIRRQREQAAWDVTRLLMILGVFALASGFEWSSRQTVAALSLAQALAYSALMIMVFVLIRRDGGALSTRLSRSQVV